MDNSGAFGSATAPLTWHDFLERMRHPSATEFVKSIKSFIVTFSNNVPDPDKDSAAAQEFFRNMEAAFRTHSLFAGCSEEELESAAEGLEKYVMTKLFNRAFASFPEDIKQDDELYEKIALLQQFIRPEHLDIKPAFQNETAWLLAQKELQKINMNKAPRDKLGCILNCCKVVNNLLLNASIASNEDPPGADEFLPVLIYITIKANPPQLHSNLLYIQRYRSQTRLVGEAAYFFTNILSAESFTWNIDGNSLSMDESEFERNMELAHVLLSGSSASSLTYPSQTDKETNHSNSLPFQTEKNAGMNPQLGGPYIKHDINEHQERRSTSRSSNPLISDLEKKGERDLLKEEQIDHIFREYPYIYAQVGDLTLNDVEALLNSYKQVVLKYVSLSKGLGQTVALDTTIKPAATERRSTDSATDGANKEDVAISKNDEEVSGMASEEAENLEYMLSQSLESDLGVHSSAEKKS